MQYALQDEINRTDVAIDVSDLPRISKIPLEVALSQNNIKKGFEKCGIWPPCRLKYKDILLDNSDETCDSENMSQSTPDSISNSAPIMTPEPSTSRSVPSSKETSNSESSAKSSRDKLYPLSFVKKQLAKVRF